MAHNRLRQAVRRRAPPGMSLSRTLRRRLSPILRGSVPLMTTALFVDNLLVKLGLLDSSPTPEGHLGGIDIEADKQYARQVAGNYAQHGIGQGRIAEIGPGGSAATALYLIANGAQHVDLLDRFVFPHDKAGLDRLYQSIMADNSQLMGLCSDDGLGDAITFEQGAKAAAEHYFVSTPHAYDAVCSCAVLEHVIDPLGVIAAATQALRPGGRHVHYVDFRDHAMYSAGGHHELTFLTVPEILYRRMIRGRGRPNRVLVHEYRASLARQPLDWEILVTSLVGVGLVEPAAYAGLPADQRARAEAEVEAIRPKLARKFRDLPASDLAISGIALVASRR